MKSSKNTQPIKLIANPNICKTLLFVSFQDSFIEAKDFSNTPLLLYSEYAPVISEAISATIYSAKDNLIKIQKKKKIEANKNKIASGEKKDKAIKIPRATAQTNTITCTIIDVTRIGKNVSPNPLKDVRRFSFCLSFTSVIVPQLYLFAKGIMVWVKLIKKTLKMIDKKFP